MRGAREVIHRATARGATVLTGLTAPPGGESRGEDPVGDLRWPSSPGRDQDAGTAWENGGTGAQGTRAAHMRGRGEG